MVQNAAKQKEDARRVNAAEQGCSHTELKSQRQVPSCELAIFASKSSQRD